MADHTYVVQRVNNEVKRSDNLTVENCVYKTSSSHKPTLECRFCDKSFTHKNSLYKHVKKKHQNIDFGGSIRCLENNCESSFKFIAHLRAHLGRNHNLEMKFENRKFLNYEDFVQWKNIVEEEGSLRYVLNTGARECGTSKTQYFRCHRSGKYIDNCQGKIRKRKIKSQGSAKIGNQCTSTMTVKVEDGRYLVTYCTTHYGHTVDIEHVFISKKEKDVLASQLAQGVSMDKILGHIRETLLDGRKSIHLLTRKNLLRIGETYGLGSSEQKNGNDTISIKKETKNTPFTIEGLDELTSPVSKPKSSLLSLQETTCEQLQDLIKLVQAASDENTLKKTMTLFNKCKNLLSMKNIKAIEPSFVKFNNRKVEF